jgi:hypothetical protein
MLPRAIRKMFEAAPVPEHFGRVLSEGPDAAPRFSFLPPQKMRAPRL